MLAVLLVSIAVVIALYAILMGASVGTLLLATLFAVLAVFAQAAHHHEELLKAMKGMIVEIWGRQGTGSKEE